MEKLVKGYGLKVKREGSYAIFNYNINCDFADPIVQEARGIILDVERREVVCWPFRKFGNHFESYADKIDWSSARVLEKVDGSIVKLWWDDGAGEWTFATNGMIYADRADIDNCPLELSFGEVIRRADNYRDIPFDRLDRDLTYIFELVSPETRVVVRYPKASLYHIGTRSRVSGRELEVDIGIKKPRSFPISSLEGCLKAAAELNKDMKEGGDVSGEGFVVVDGSYNRVKVKSAEYLVMSRLTQMKTATKADCIEIITSRAGDIPKILEANPDLAPYFKYYDFRLAELRVQVKKMAQLARALMKELDGRRGDVAKVIVKHPLGFVGFRAIERPDATPEELYASVTPDKILRLIPDYLPEKLEDLLLSVRK